MISALLVALAGGLGAAARFQSDALIARAGRWRLPIATLVINTLGSLLLGIPSSDGLRFVGKAGSGFTDAALVQAHRALEPLARSTTPFVEVTGRDAQNAHWVEPTLVGEVYYTEATSAGRLRHPVWKGWRPDVPPSTVVWE